MRYFPVNYLPGAGPLGGEEESPQDQGVDKTLVESTLDVHEAANPGSRDETLGKIDSEGLFIEAQAKAEVAAGLPNPSKIIDDGILNQQDPEAVRLSLEGLISKQDALSKVHPNLEAALLASLEESETMDINYVSNRDMMEKMLRKAYVEAGNDDVGILRTGFDFIDYHIFGMVGRTYEDLTNRTSRLGFTLNDIAKLPPDEAKEKMQLYTEEINKEGAFNNNSFAWDQALREFSSMGYNSDAGSDFAMGVVDVATSGTLAIASRAGKTAARKLMEQKILRSPLGRYNKVANIKGPEEAGKLVKAAAERGDPDAIVQGGTSLINLGAIPKKVVIQGVNDPRIGGAAGQAANAEGVQYNLSFRERLSRFKVKDVEVALSRIPDADLSKGLSEENLLKIERALGTNMPTEAELNSFFTNPQRMSVNGTTVVGGGVRSVRKAPEAANAEGKTYNRSFRERLSDFTVKEFEELISMIPEANLADGLSGDNLLLIERAIGKNNPTGEDLNKFFAGRKDRVSVDGVTSVGGGVTSVRAAGQAANDIPSDFSNQLFSSGSRVTTGNASGINTGVSSFRGLPSGAANSGGAPTGSRPTAANSVGAPTPQASVGTTQVLQPPVPPAVASAGIRNNEILQIVEDTIKKRSAGTMFSEDDVLRITDEVKQSWVARASSPVFDIKPMDLPFHELGFAIKIGDKFGNPFFGEDLARKGAQVLSRDVQARVTPVPVDDLDPSKGYVLQLEQRIANSAAKAEFELNPVSAIRRLMGSTFGSSASMDVVEEMAKGANLAKVDNYANAVRGQDAATKINKEVGNKLKFIKSIDKDSLFAIGEVFRDLRDGIDASRKDVYSVSEFEAKFAMFHPQRRLPTQRETEAYMNILDLEEAAWMVKASTKLNKFLEAGMESITLNGQKMVGKKVDFNSVPKDAGILDASGNVVRKINTTVGHTPFKTDAIFQLMDPLTNGITYIRNPEAVKPLAHKDVLPFNAGGRRTYSDGRYFVVFKNADGTPAAKLTALTQKQADTAGKQLNAILDAAKAGHPDLDSVVRSNNSWDPSVKSYQDFQKWLADNNVIGDGKFTWKTDGGILDDTDWAAGAARVPGLTWQEKVAGSASRQDKPLAKFGGGKAHVEDPLTSIGETFASATNQLTNAVAINKGVNAWVKALRASTSSGWTVPQEIQDSGDAFAIFRAAQPTNQLTEQGRRLKEIRDIINRRHGIARSQNLEDVVQQWLNNYAENILDSKLSDLSVLDKKPIKWLGSRIVDMGNPANNLLKLGFGANFGFFALDQLIVQASHGLILGPIIAWDTRAMRAMMGTNSVRVALAARGTPTGDMAVQRLAKYLGEDVATTKKFIEYIEISGRSIVGTEAIEMGWAGSSVLNRKAGQSAPTAFEKGVEASKQAASSFFDKSLWAYKLGEHSSRLSTMSAAFFKYRKEFPLGDPLSEEGLAWITRKEQAYAFHMTNAGRSRWQEGLMRFPTQWLAYGMRSMEAVFIGRDLTAAERTRASLAMFAFFGTNGAALGWANDWMAEKLGIDPGGELYQAIKYGVLDAGLSALGVDVAISDRIAPIKGIVDTFQNVAEDSAVETLAGPSASIVGGGIRSLSSAINNIVEGNVPLTVQDLNNAARTIRSYDNISKAWGIYKYGFIMSKTGMKYEAEYDALDAVMQGLGLSPREVSLLNQKRSEKFKTDQEMRDLRKKYNSYMAIALAKIGSDLEFEKQKGYDLMRSIAVSIQALEGLSPSERYSLQRGLFLDKKDLVEEIYTNEVKREKAYSAEAFRRIMKGD